MKDYTKFKFCEIFLVARVNADFHFSWSWSQGRVRSAQTENVT